jgi:hypothetical protein
MIKSFLIAAMAMAFYYGTAQVKIGGNPTSVNPSAVLELSNNTADSPSTWKGFMPPKVNFSNIDFVTNEVWGIAGTPVEGILVYNIAESYDHGFSGPGLYCWIRNGWYPVNISITDKIRLALSSSTAAYDAATVNSWVNVTATEYNNLTNIVQGAAKYGIPEIFMNTSSNGGWSPNYTVGGNNNSQKVPSSSYIIAWSVRTGSGTSSSLGSKLKISTAQKSNYIDYGNPLPSIGNISINTRIYFVLKAPYVITPASPCYTAVYNALTFFLGNNSNAGSGPEFYGTGDNSGILTSFPSDSFSQVISTTIRQW